MSINLTQCINDSCSRKSECYRYRLIPNPNLQRKQRFPGQHCFMGLLPGDQIRTMAEIINERRKTKSGI